jgi:hypothetical protein
MGGPITKDGGKEERETLEELVVIEELEAKTAPSGLAALD